MPVSKPADLPAGGGGRWPHLEGGFRAARWGDLEIGYTTAGPMDCTPVYAGLLGGVCPCPHYGYVFRGRLRCVYTGTDGRACWLDFQVTQLGHWSVDVSYHLATALDVADRRDHERELLAGYFDELGALGVDAPSRYEAWERYSLGFSWGYLLWTITRISTREVVLIHMPRLGRRRRSRHLEPTRGLT